MGSKFFGEYLVENQFLKSEALVSALVEQTKNLPSVLEVVVKESLLDHDQILSALSLQSRTNKSFMEACRELGIWNSDVESRVSEQVVKSRVPLGQVLMSQGHLDFETLVRALDDFLSSVETADDEERPTVEKDSSVTVGADLLKDFGEVLSDGLKLKLLDGIDAFGSNSDSRSGTEETVRELFDCFHMIRGASRFVQARRSESLVGKIEECLTLLKSKDAARGVQNVGEFWESLRVSVDIIWTMKDDFFKTGNEESYFENSEKRERYEKLYKRVEDFRLSFDSL